MSSDLLEVVPPEAPADCPICPRLVAYRQANRASIPQGFNGAVPSFGDPQARLAVVGLAPGRMGANRTGRPFTGDGAGWMLYGTLLKTGFARGDYQARPDDGLTLVDCMITNAVRCAPPENKPVGEEINTCRGFLKPTLGRFPNLAAVVTLGAIAHQSVVRALGARVAALPFRHGARYEAGTLTVFPSYHCSRYNTNTGVLTEAMFVNVFRAVAEHLKA